MKTNGRQIELFPSIIVLSFNTKEILIQCIDSIIKESLAWGKPVEVIVVDNGSIDGSPQAIRERFRDVIVLENRDNLGFSRGNNRGIRESKGNPVITLNSDTVLSHGFFSKVEREFSSEERIGIIAPRLLNKDGSLQISAYHNYPDPIVEIFGYTPIGRAAQWILPWVNYPFKYALTAREHDLKQEVSHVKGACLIMDRAMLNEIGGFDEDFFLYREETDLCKRAHDCGWKIIYNPEICIYHHHKASSHFFSDKGLTYRLTSHYLYIKKHHGWFFRVIAYTFFLLFSIIMTGSMTIGRIFGSQKASSGSSYYAKVLGWHLKNPRKCF
jgi:GT2 family glycosyltransferase